MARVLEQGDIYFVYRPRVGEEQPEGVDDVQRLFAILGPRDKDVYRRLVIGRKRLPNVQQHERSWAFVDRVARRPEPVEEDLEAHRYETQTRGEREQPAGRPAGEGVYAIVEHDDHVHLAYALELPHAPGDVQGELGIEPEASYVVTVRNPEAPSVPRAGLPRRDRPSYPHELQEQFAGRRFAPLDPAFLDHEGAELILIGAHEEPEDELDVDLEPERETAETADIFRDLHLSRESHPVRPLFEGAWD